MRVGLKKAACFIMAVVTAMGTLAGCGKNTDKSGADASLSEDVFVADYIQISDMGNEGVSFEVNNDFTGLDEGFLTATKYVYDDESSKSYYCKIDVNTGDVISEIDLNGAAEGFDVSGIIPEEYK
ncbi:MAG: hypothetical protein IJ796_06795 [Lachnospiraceae bacterium]|nr:hypothetical protein [Lachnospiraceae bacterium]